MNNSSNDGYTNEAMMFEACDEDDFLPFINVPSDDDNLLANYTIDTISNLENSVIMITDESDDDSIIFVSSYNINGVSTGECYGKDANDVLASQNESDIIPISAAEYYGWDDNDDLFDPNVDDVIPISAAEFYGWDDNDDDELLKAVNSITNPEPYSFGNI